MRVARLSIPLLGALLSAALLPACKPPPAAFAPPPPPKVTVEQPRSMTVPQVIEATGTTRGADVVELRARVRGFIARKLFQGGERVKTGDLLVVIDPREYEARVMQAEAEVASRQAALALAQVTLERAQQAQRGGAATDLEVKQMIAARDQAGAAVELAEAALMQARLDLEFTQVKSPINGRLSIMLPDVGQLVGANDSTLLASVMSEDRVLVRYNLSEAELLDLRRQFQGRRPGEDGRPNDIVVRMQLLGEQGFPHEGRFAKGDNSVDPTTGTISLDAEFPNPDGAIIPGLFVRLQSVVAEQQQLVVPDTAVQQDQQGRFVLVVNPQNEVQRRDVRVGRVLDRQRVVLSGLDGSERVIVNGLQRARDGTKVEPVLAGQAPAGAAAPAQAVTGR